MVFERGIASAIALLDDDDEEQLLLLLLSNEKKTRRVKYRHRRIDWFQHVEMCTTTGGFERRYHMTYNSFKKLLELLRPMITVDELQSMRSTSGNSPIIPEIIVASGLRYLGGSSSVDIADLFGISLTSADRIVNTFLNAVDCKLHISPPTTDEELRKAADDWDALSGCNGIFYGVIGAIDGWLCCTQTPSDVENPADYFSGHYQRHGINVQAVCDANLRFIYWGVVAPGRSNDGRVFGRCMRLRMWLNGVPDGYFLLGDNAYTNSNKMVTPFPKPFRDGEYNRSYNFYLSQLRIRIEMAFGRLTTKWRIFRRNLDCSSEKNSLIIRCAGKLHNFVIDNDNLSFPSDATYLDEFGVERLGIDNTNVSENNNGFRPALIRRSQRPSNRAVGRHTEILEEIKARDVRRPAYNILRNELEGEEQRQSVIITDEEEPAYEPEY